MKSELYRLPVPFRPLSVIACLLLASVALPLPAAEKTWDGEGADNNWQTAGNWDPISGGSAPVANDSLFFDGATRTAPVNNFPAGAIFQSLTFNGGADAFTLSGNALVITNPPAAVYTGGLNAPYVGGSISNTSPNTETISLPLTLANGHHHIVSIGGGTLNLSGALTLGSGASVTFSTAVNVTGSGLANVNGILGGWATMNPPANWAALDGSGNVIDYVDYTDINAGSAIASAAASNVRITDSGPNVTLAAAGVTDINTLHFGQGPTANQTVAVTAGQILRLGAKGAIFNASRQITGTSRILTIGTGAAVGTVTAGGADNTPGDLYLIETPFIGNTGNQLVMNSRITNNGTAAVTVHMFGHISFPNVAHTYSGGTYIHGGRLSATGPNTIGTGPVFVYPGGQLFLNAAGTYTNTMFIAGLGNAESVGNGAIRMGGRTISGNITLQEDAATANGTLSGVISGPGRLIVGAGSGNGVGTLTIGSAAGANTYSGDTIINGTNATGASTLTIATSRNNIMPRGVGKGNVILNGATVVATLNLNNTTQTINGLSSVGSAANNLVVNNTAGVVTFTVGDGDASGNFGGIIQTGTGGIALSKIGTGTQTLSGPNTYTNGTTVNAGTLSFTAPNSFPTAGLAPVTVNSNATLNVAGACPVTLAAGQSLVTSNGTITVALQSGGNAVTTPTLTAIGATNYVGITSIPAIITYPAQFVAIKCTTLNGSLNFGLGGSLPVSPGSPYVAYISNNIANNSVDLVVTSGPASIRWQGYGGGSPNSAWDTTTANWVDFGGTPLLYTDGSFVRFDDSASNQTVTLSQNVLPAGITISNAALSYTIDGGSAISGAGGLIKQGTGTAIIDNGGINDFSGGITISAGSLRFGNNDANGNVPAGNIVNNGNLAFARTDAYSLPNAISGGGTLTQNGSGSLLLGAGNTFTGAVSVLQGTLQTGNSAALGTTNGGTTIASGATLDITANNINLGQEVITVSGIGVGGNGALVNSSAPAGFVGPNVARVIMTGDTRVGGTGRFDLRSATTGNPALGSLSCGGQPYRLTQVGSAAFGLIGITVDPQLGDIVIQSGILSIEAATTGLGNPASNLVVYPGGTFQMFAATNLINKIFTIGGDGVSTNLSATSGSTTIIGPMAVTNDSIFNAGGAAVSLTLSNVITGPGKITKIGAGTLIIAGNSPNYAGGLQQNLGNVILSGTLSNSLGVAVGSGKFTLNGSLLGGGVTNTSFTSLAGNGVSAGAAEVGGDLFPGDTNVIGTLTLGGLVLQSGAALYYDLASINTPGSGTNDLVVVNGDLVINGNNVTINPLGLLLTGAGNKYRLFNYTGNLVWNSDLTVTGPNSYTFAVDTNTAGQVNIVVSGGPPVWNGGSATVNNWSDAANWGGVTIQPGNQLFFAGSTRMNNTNDSAAGTTYNELNFVSGAGAFTLNGNSITLEGNVINNAANQQTINLGMNLGASRSFNGNAAALNILGGITNTAVNNTLTLGGTGVLANAVTTLSGTETNLIATLSTNASWTLVDNAISTAMTNPTALDIQAGTFNFGTGGSAPKLVSTSGVNTRLGVIANAPATLNMAGGELTIAVRLNTGAGGNAIAALNQSGGTINIRDVFQSSDSAATASTVMNVTGGLFNVGDEAGAARNVFLASRGTGIVTVASSGVIRCATLDMSRNAAGNTLGSVGVFNLNGGGTLIASRIGAATSAAQAGGTPTATFNFHGGTLQAGASSTTFIQGNASAPTLPVACIVKAGGAIVDSTNFNISILEPMQHDSTLGATPDGGLRKLGTGALTLTAANTYTGPTVVSNGTLIVNGTLAGGAVTVRSGGTLSGTASLGGTVTVDAGGVIAPAGFGVIGTLTAVGNVSLSGTTVMEVSKTGLTKDLLTTSGTVTYGGTLTATNLAGTLAVGDSFKVFNGSSYLGSFTTVTPPAIGLRWDTSLLNTSGTISIVAVPTPSITDVGIVAGNVVVSGAGGLPGGPYVVLTSTDVGLPLSSWTPIGGGFFNGGGGFSFTNGVPTDPQRYYAVQAQ